MMRSPNPASHARALRWAFGVGVAIVAAIALVLVFLLTVATNNRALYERNYAWLFGVNVVVALLLFGVLVWVAVRLAARLRRGRFGSRLLVKLAAIFALVGLMPGLLIYVVSYQFVSRSIESWFDVRVEGALTAGVSLARATLETQSSEAGARTRSASNQLSQVPDAAAGLVLERIRDQLGATDVVLWSAAGQVLASTGQSRFDLNPERPSTQQLRNVRQNGVVAQIEGLDDFVDGAKANDARVRALALVSSASLGLLDEPRFLQVTLPLPPVLVANALAVQEANREYQERALARGGLRRMYIGTLTLSLFLAVFTAVLLAVLLGNQLVRPLLVLAEGVREVAEGNLSPKAALQSKDELSGLTRSFALMTAQLADARATVEQTMSALDAGRERLQTIMDNLTAGIIVLDAQGNVRSSNPGATRILRAPMAAYEDRPLAQVPGLADFAAAVQRQFDAFLDHRGHRSLNHWQHSFELHASPSGVGHHATSLVARGAELPDAARLLVFDDISEIVSAQRTQAWGEVARRLAHEIKNPLTPIQLSAERLSMKLEGKLAPPEQAMLTKSVKTIVDQVDALKRLVNEFRDYARLPAAELLPLDLNQLVTEVLHLYEADHGSVPVLARLDPRCPRILGDAQQLRQVLHNLVQNGQDATAQALASAAPAPAATEPMASPVATAPMASPDGAAAVAHPFPAVHISTHWNAETQRVRLSVADRGGGFPPHILQRAFEPYVTTKVRGTGLGLAVVKKIADEHAARIHLTNFSEGALVAGAQVSLSFAPEPTVAS